jgi:DNA-3-methyladenine glycosylase II
MPWVMGTPSAHEIRRRVHDERMEKVSERWKPYRSVASWYLWRHIDGGGW